MRPPPLLHLHILVCAIRIMTSIRGIPHTRIVATDGTKGIELAAMLFATRENWRAGGGRRRRSEREKTHLRLSKTWRQQGQSYNTALEPYHRDTTTGTGVSLSLLTA